MDFGIFLNKFIGIGTLFLHIFLVLLLVSFIYHKITKKKLPKLGASIKCFLSENGILLAFLLVLGSTIGSLVYSEVIGIPACDLCWYQRALIYPQVVILLVALIKKEKKIFDYVLGLNVIGLIIGGYQYFMQMVGYSGPCPISGGVNCFAKDVIEFGYITIPAMSLTVFITVIVLTWMAKKSKDKKEENTEA